MERLVLGQIVTGDKVGRHAVDRIECAGDCGDVHEAYLRRDGVGDDGTPIITTVCAVCLGVAQLHLKLL